MPTIISRKTIDSDISESIEMGVSQSEDGLYDLCHYRWYLERVKMLTSLKPEFILTVGTSFHSGMDWMYRSNGKKIGVPPLVFNKFAKLTPEEEEEAEHWHKVLSILIEAYRVNYKDDFNGSLKIISLEQVLRRSIEGITFCGALDLTVEHLNSIMIWDHKTKGIKAKDSINTDEWKTRFQFLLYTLMWNLIHPDQKVRYFMVNLIHKPAIRLKQGESRPAFYARLKADVAHRMDDYFKREKFPLTSNILQAFIDNFLKPKIAKFKLLQTVKPKTLEYQALVLHRNSASCWAYGRQCPFYAHCHNGKTLEQIPYLVVKKAKHEHYEEKAD